MAGAAARMVSWPIAAQQHHVRGSGISAASSAASSSSSCHALLRSFTDRMDRFLPLPSLVWVKRSNRGSVVMLNGKLNELRGSARAVITQVGEATAAGVRETVGDLEVGEGGHSRSLERAQTEQGAHPSLDLSGLPLSTPASGFRILVWICHIFIGSCVPNLFKV